MAQAIHAATIYFHEHPELANAWLTSSNYLVCLSVDSEVELVKLMERANQIGLTYSEMIEFDLDNQLTAIALQPGSLSREICAKLPLALRAPKATDRDRRPRSPRWTRCIPTIRRLHRRDQVAA